MKLGRRRLDEPQIGLTPLIDVVFLLLIFFMVTTSFVHEAGLAVALPEAGEGQPPSVDGDTVTVVVDAGDRIVIDGQRIRPGLDLRGELAALRENADSLRIRADGRASHQAVVAVMDAAAAAGFRGIDIATRPAQPER